MTQYIGASCLTAQQLALFFGVVAQQFDGRVPWLLLMSVELLSNFRPHLFPGMVGTLTDVLWWKYDTMAKLLADDVDGREVSSAAQVITITVGENIDHRFVATLIIL